MTCGTGKFAVAIGIVVACAGTARGGEWSVTPEFSWLADHNSNRALREDTPASSSLGASIDFTLARRSENSSFEVRPHYRLQRFEDHLYPNVDDKQLAALARWTFESSALDLDAQAAEESTLTTELAETGLVRADSNRRTYATGLGWRYDSSENRQFSLSVSYQDVDYTGAYEDILTGYRYASANVGESFTLSPRVALSVNAFGSQLRNGVRDSTSNEHGVSLGMQYAWTERTTMSASFGVSREVTGGDEKSGTTRDFSLEHKSELLVWSLSYSHRLQPYGTGVLAEHDSAQLQMVRALSPRFSALLRGGYSRNDDDGFGFTFDSRSYRFGESEIRWQVRETLGVSLSTGYSNAKQDATFFSRAEDASGWSVAFRTRWAPRAYVIGH